MFMGNREHSAGGPFFRDIDFQSGSAVEIYNCIFTATRRPSPIARACTSTRCSSQMGRPPSHQPIRGWRG
jgi:hypothetical protein